MKRTTLMAALTGAAVLLAGCSSTSGTAAPASTSSSATSSATVMSSSSAPASAASSMSAPVSPAASGSAPASQPASSEMTSSGTASSDTASSETASSEGAAATNTPVSTSTVGDATGALDAPSTAWFSAFCGGVAPIVTGATSLTSLSGSASSAASQKKIATLFTTMGTSLTKTAADLKALPAPTFAGGAAFAARVEAAFAKAGPALAAGGKKITADPSQADATASGLADSMTAAVAPLQDLDSLKLTPATQAAIEKIPACATVAKAATG